MKDAANLTIHLPHTKLNVAPKCKIKSHAGSTSCNFACDLIIMCISNVQFCKGGSTNEEITSASMGDLEESVKVKLSHFEGVILEPVEVQD